MTKISQTEKKIQSADDADYADKKGQSALLLPLLRNLHHQRINILSVKVLGSNGVPGRSSLPKPSRAGWYYRIHRVGLGVTRIILLMPEVFNAQPEIFCSLLAATESLRSAHLLS